ncbi:MAG TPA: hypothetical protein PK715_08730, partial [Chitinophagales bacterium]|nr:hypothetical protein [Chitinophagales bacterium]
AWSNLATTADITGLGSGIYIVTVTDSNGCTAVESATITDLGGITLSLTTTDATCGLANGSITGTVSGGSGSYTYEWDNGSADANLTNLSGGTYSVTVTDSNGCTATASGTITDLGNPTVSLTAVNATCGLANGSITGTVSGGSGSYTYEWENLAVTPNLTGLTGGVYTVTVTDSNGCTATASATVTAFDNPTITLTANDATCGDTNGSITGTVSGGSGSYTYAWSNLATTADITGLGSGIYFVTVTDSNGCTATANETVSNLGGPDAIVDITPATCGNANGGVTLTVSGGSGGYSFVWDNAATTQNLTNVAAGTYTVTITDSSGCESVLSATVTQPDDLTLTETHTNVSCAGGINGSINLTVSGGSGSYTYQWSNTITTEDQPFAPAGTYTVTVTDTNNCTATLSVTITQPTPLALSETHVNATCIGGANGSIDLSVSGGTGAYTYLWSNSLISQDITNLTAGAYTVTVSDANNCTASLSVTITNNGSPIPSINNITNAACGNADGAVDINMIAGTQPYTYQWSNAATTQDLTGVAAGTYTVTVTDTNGCTGTLTAAVSNIGGPALSLTAVVNATCEQANGSIDLTVTGGTAPFTYEWSNLETDEDLTNIPGGAYTVTVTDALGCLATLAADVDNLATPTISAIVTDATCEQANGSINITVSGVGAPFNYIWSNSLTSEDLNNVVAGSYTVTVTDSNGCTTTSTETINDIPSQMLNLVATASTCGAANGSVDLTVSGGQAPFIYNWSNTATTEDLADVLAGNYTVTVTDATGCVATGFITVGNAPEPTLSVVSTVHSTCGNNNGSITVSASGGVGAYLYSWSHDVNLTANTATDLSPGSYLIGVSDENNCVAVLNVTINAVSQPNLQVQNVVHTTCGNDNGSITLQTVGGGGGNTYQWSPNSGTVTATATGLATGTYFATVTDNNGCIATISAVVNPSTGVTLTFDATDAACGLSNGSIDLAISGGAAPYTYIWSNTQSTEDITNLAAGIYFVTVSDATGCTATGSATITNLGNPSADALVTDAICGSANGAINLTVTGGVAPYTYAWTGGLSGANPVDVASGSYTVTVTDA